MCTANKLLSYVHIHNYYQNCCCYYYSYSTTTSTANPNATATPTTTSNASGSCAWLEKENLNHDITHTIVAWRLFSGPSVLACPTFSASEC